MTIELHGSGHGTVRGQKVVGHEPARKLVRSSPATGDWIDFRASLARVARREESGERPEVCADCGTEVDVPEPAHSPRCKEIRPVEESRPPERSDPGASDAAEPDMMEEVDAALSPEEPAHVGGAKNHRLIDASGKYGCKIPGCDGRSRDRKGPYAYLCEGLHAPEAIARRTRRPLREPETEVEDSQPSSTGRSSLASSPGSPSGQPSLRETLDSLLGSAIAVLEAARRELDR